MSELVDVDGYRAVRNTCACRIFLLPLPILLLEVVCTSGEIKDLVGMC